MAVVLAIVAAVGWGASDYFGGAASRRDTSVLAVLAISESLGVLLLVPLLVARGDPPPADPRLLLAVLAGAAVTVELSLIYRALSQGLAFITAPIGALGAACAVAVGLIGGDPLSLVVALGLTGALLGGAISAWRSPDSASSDAPGPARAALICLGAAGAVAVMLSALHAAGRLDPSWATAVEHTSTGLTAGLAARVGARRPVRAALPTRAQLPTLALIAIVGVGGDLAYATASHRGALTIVSALSSLYPVTTIVLGRVLGGRCATRLQAVGIVLSLCGAALLGAATH